MTTASRRWQTPGAASALVFGLALVLGLAPPSVRAEGKGQWHVGASTGPKNHVYLVRSFSSTGPTVLVTVTVQRGNVEVRLADGGGDTVYAGNTQSFLVPPGKVLGVWCDERDHQAPAEGTFTVEAVR